MVTVMLEDMTSQQLSHELNISLTGIKGGIELLDISGLTNAQQEQLQMILDAENRLEKVVNKILTHLIETTDNDTHKVKVVITKLLHSSK